MESAPEGQRTATADEEDAAANHDDETQSADEEKESPSSREDSDGESTEKSEGDGHEGDGQADDEQHDDPEAKSEGEDGQADSGDAKSEGNDEQGEDDDEEGGAASGASTAYAIDDVSSLPGETINDQDGRKIGEVKEIYGVGDDETPMWVTIESATGLGRSRDVFVPLARIKKQADEIRVPYSYGHVHESPEVEPEDELSEEDDRALRVYYAIGLADQELVENAQSYASQVPEEDDAGARKMDADSAEGPVREIDDTPPAKRAAEAYEKQKEEEGEDHRKSRDATADDIVEEDGPGDSDEKDDKSEDDEEKDSKEQPTGEGDQDDAKGQEDEGEDSEDERQGGKDEGEDSEERQED